MLASRRVHLDWKAACERRPHCSQPRHWRLMWEPTLFEGLPSLGGMPEAALASQLADYAARIDTLLRDARALEWTRKGLVVSQDDRVDGGDTDGYLARPLDGRGADRGPDGATLPPLASGAGCGGEAEPLASSPSVTEVCSTLAGCSLVAGMHADGATEGIIDFALRTGKPFAVVPCCICPPSKPMSYLAFIRHLVAKAPGRVRTKSLPFEGKNVVVYGLPLEEQIQEPERAADDESCFVCETIS